MARFVLLDKSIVANTFGNTMEIYDYVLYGGLATYISQHFFPAKTLMVSLIMTFGAFAAGFLMRPLGAIFYGRLGDKHGRRRALLWSVLMMGLPTFLLGLIPGYDKVGIVAPILVVLIRLFQGFSVGGEFTGSITYLSEMASVRRRGYLASFAMFGGFSGALIAPMVILIVSKLIGEHQFASWGWRIPFFLSAPMGTALYFLRKMLTETSAFLAEVRDSRESFSPLRECLSRHKVEMLNACGISVQVGIGFWIIIVYMVTYSTRILHQNLEQALWINFGQILVAMITILLVGRLSKYVRLKTRAISSYSDGQRM